MKFEQRNTVSLCHKDKCIHAQGKNARIIAKGAFFLMFGLGVAAIAKSLN